MNKITKESIASLVDEGYYKPRDNKKEIKMYAFGYVGKNGEIRCKALEDFDKAMKKQFNKNTFK